MRPSWKKLLFRLLGLELLGKELLKLLAQGLHSFKTRLRRKLLALAFKLLAGLLGLALVLMAIFFSFTALALYLNSVLSSFYLGFLVVAGGCAGIVLLAFLYQVVRRYWP